MLSRRFIIVFLLVLAPIGRTCGQVDEPGDKTDSLENKVALALAKLSHPKLEERTRLLRSYQRRGYASSLKDVLNIDGVSAMLSYLKTRLQIELSLPHDLILVNISAVQDAIPRSDSSLYPRRSKFSIILPTRPNQQMRVGVDIDWTFPADPWSRK